MLNTPTAITVSELSEARELRSVMPDSRRERSYLISLAIFSVNMILYLASFVFMFVVDQPAINIGCAIINGMVIGLLFIVGHDACHGSFTPSSMLNRVLGRLSFLPSLQPYTSWAYTHNGLHHGWTNLKGKDVVFPPFSLNEYQALSWPRRILERVYRSAFGVAFMYVTQIWWKYEVLPDKAHTPKNVRLFQYDRLLVIAFFIMQVAASLLLSFALSDNLYYVIGRAGILLILSYYIWFLLIGVITFQQHTHPKVPWYNKPDEWNYYRGQIHGTPHLEYPTWLQRLLHNIMEHNAHHVDPLVPMYQLKPSQQTLEQACGKDIITNYGYVSEYLKTLRICCLYDFDKHQWTDYNGKPTSPAGLNVLASQIQPSAS